MLNKNVMYSTLLPKSESGVESVSQWRRGILIGVLTEADVLVGLIEEEDGNLISVHIDNIRVVR